VARDLTKCRLDLVEVKGVRWGKAGTERAEVIHFFCGKGNGNYHLGTEFSVNQIF
jgi:hypothetical protein